MNHNNLFAARAGRMLISLVLVVAVILAAVPMHSQAGRSPNAFLPPVPVNPPDQLVTVVNYPPRAMPYFEWQPVDGATSYRIRIAQDIAFTTIRYDAVTTNTRFMPTYDDNLVDGDVYWQVRVESPSPSDYSAPQHFLRNWATNNAPSLTAPAAGEVIHFFEAPAFSWTPVMGAAYYRLSIYATSACSTAVNDFYTSETSYNPTYRLNNGTYYWRVLPYNKSNQSGGASECRMFIAQYDSTATLLLPANGSFPQYTPQFKWTAVKGAVYYWLYYSTDNTFQSGVAAVRTAQTSFTPRDSLPNDVNYYWKVRVEYQGGAIGPDSDIWSFQKRWYHQPIVLTPRNTEAANMMLFSWTPVREAAYYRIEGAFDPGFTQMKWNATTPNTFFWRNWGDIDEWGKPQYIRVRPIDRNNNNGKDSISISYRPTYTLALPEHIFPRYFYSPPSVATGNYVSPKDIPVSYDYTVDTPTFYWSRVFIPGADPRVEASWYRIEVDDDINFGSPNWTYSTQNLSASPTEGAPFVPISTTVYYWRVTPLASVSPLTVLPASTTNQPWATRIDTTRQSTPTTGISPTLLRPLQNEKAMDTLPSFDWSPYSGAVRYELEISTRSDFATTAYVTQTIYSHHTPNIRLPQDTYFWHVRALNGGGQQLGQWSEARRLIVAYQTRWECAQTQYLPFKSGTLLASDSYEGGSTDLTTLYSGQDKDNWQVGFNYDPGIATPVTFTLYLDIDQTDGKGATTAPPGRAPIGTVNYYQPEFAINVRYTGAGFDTSRVELFEWDPINNMWNPQIKNLLDNVQVGGSMYVSPTLSYVELKIPKTAVGDGGSDPFMLSLALFSTTSNSATTVSDSTPDNGAGAAKLERFVSIADRMNLDIPVADQATAVKPVSVTPYMYAETANVDLLRGFRIEVSRDPLFTAVMDTVIADCVGCNNFIDAFQNVYSPPRIYEDNTLYWRYAIKHGVACADSFAPPSEPHNFTKQGLVPANLQTASQYSTPTFKWDDVESAAYYQVQAGTNPNFSSNNVDEQTNHNNLTPQFPLAPGKYYWRVRALNDLGSYASGWSISSTVNITLPTVTLLQPASGATTHDTPTFKWASVLTPTVQPEWAGVSYHVQIADSPNGFTSPFREFYLDSITFTPPYGLPDKTYYWRVAVRDASNYEGPYSQVFTFTKQYSVTTLLEPTVGSQSGGYPTFKWTAIDGAAYYRIQIATNPQFTQIVRNDAVDNTWYVPVDKLPDATYYWRVAMVDNDGNIGPYNDATLIVSAYPYKVYVPLIKK